MKDKCHLDCESYLAVDVFKGICSTKKEMVAADETGCGEFVQVQKCRTCKNYTADDDYLGSCKGVFITYPDLLAKTCADFK